MVLVKNNNVPHIFVLQKRGTTKMDIVFLKGMNTREGSHQVAISAQVHTHEGSWQFCRFGGQAKNLVDLR
jgi:hypothetical protein